MHYSVVQPPQLPILFYRENIGGSYLAHGGVINE